ncbi:MAG: endonuclease/exonuclease/phosphatase family protein [Firmicutes bacterium]|nr:endonuclease/exonuclease/phosphatase family protein [Bacillota bacterium]
MDRRLRLMTHNIWNRDENSPQWAEKGFDCSAEVRVHGLLRVYRETQPDVIGCQEASVRMADLLKEGLTAEGMNYTLIWGRFTPILYRPDRLELVDSEFGTYPEHIDGMEGSFNDVRSKSWNIAVFRVKESGRLFLFAATHLWWKMEPTAENPAGRNVQEGSDRARELQLALLTDRILEYYGKYGCPAFLVGDLNTGYLTPAVQTALRAGFRHAHDIAEEYAEEAVGYHYCFPDGFETYYYDRPFERAIDHILVYGAAPGTVKRFERYSPDYYYPVSDHSAAYVDVEI